MSCFRIYSPILIIILYVFINYNEATLLSRQDLKDNIVNVSLAETTLIFTNVLFRHGDRAPTPISSYATDPNKYASYWPLGIGLLTKKGMLAAYKLGLELRQRYGNFLGPRYFPDLVGSLSSPKARCQTTLQCVLTSLFPPMEDDLFLSEFLWRPINYDILPSDKDDTFAIYECENYWDLQSAFTNKTVLDLINVLEENTGEKIWNISSIFLIKDTIEVADKLGKTQPDWVSTVYPEPINSAANMLFYAIVEQKLKLGAAGLYRRIIENIVNKLNGNLSPPSGIKAYNGQAPKMASYLALELHHINGTYGIKVFLQNYEDIDPVPIDILNQGHFCPLDVFLKETRWLTEDPKPYCTDTIK